MRILVGGGQIIMWSVQGLDRDIGLTLIGGKAKVPAVTATALNWMLEEPEGRRAYWNVTTSGSVS